ncbi:hypothetical protein CR513_54325, partial [Mucuna pruriens]
MAIIGCSSDGQMDDAKFSKPMPWIGIYIAAASLACLIAVSADLIHGIRGRKLWFPSKFFCLNATTLAIIAVAVKLSVDLNTPMPHRHDQLSKLSSSAMICTIMANSMPSLGVTENKDTMMNLMAVVILVVTMIVNICIQFVTGVIYVFWVEHALIMLLMLILLMTMTASAISIPKMKHYFELKYKINEEALKESSNEFGEEGNQVVNILRDRLMKIWMMSHTSSPQFMGIVLMCKATQYVSIFLMFWIMTCYDHCKKLKSKVSFSISSVSSEGESKPVPKLDLRRFVLHLEGEEEFVEVMMNHNRDATNHWIQVGEKKQPKLLIELLEKCSFLQGFKGVEAFDSDQVFSLHAQVAPYSWSLPLVTLASIVVALPNINRDSVKKLVNTLNEGLPFVKFVENNMDKGELVKLRTAAEIVWLGVDLYDKWLDVDLHELSLQDKSLKETLEKLADAAKIRYEKSKAKYNHICMTMSPSFWPPRVLACHSMYRICKTALSNHELTTSERLFEAVTVMISDILGACLTNLPRVISNKCWNSAIEEREDTVRHAVYILGKTKKIIEMIEKRVFPRVDFCRGSYIEDWRLMHKQNSFSHFVPSFLENDTHAAPPKSSDFCLNID